MLLSNTWFTINKTSSQCSRFLVHLINDFKIRMLSEPAQAWLSPPNIPASPTQNIGRFNEHPTSIPFPLPLLSPRQWALSTARRRLSPTGGQPYVSSRGCRKNAEDEWRSSLERRRRTRTTTVRAAHDDARHGKTSAGTVRRDAGSDNEAVCRTTRPPRNQSSTPLHTQSFIHQILVAHMK